MEPILPYIIPVIIAAVISFVACFWVRRWAIGHKAIPNIRERDVHKKAVPRLGGLGIVIAFWMTLIIFLIFQPQSLDFVKLRTLGIDRNLFGVILGAAIIISVMVIDDLKGLKWGYKLIGQFAAASVVAFTGVTISWLTNPFGSMVQLGHNAFTAGGLSVSWGQIFVILWIVLVINVVNWLDGLDGLASGISIIVAGTLFMLALSPRVAQPATAMLAAILIGSVVGFMPYNLNPARMFLGDTGSMFIGYMLAVLAIISGGKVATASLVMGIPLIDGVWVIVNRLMRHKSIFEADKSHIHHRLMKAGLNVRQTVMVLYAASILLGYLALRSGPEGKFWSVMWLMIVMLFLSLGLIILEWLRRANKQKI